MKKYVLIGLTTIISANAFADVGLGVSVQQQNSIIYIPITTNNNFRLEPYISYYDSETSTKDSDGDTSSTEHTQLTIGAGLFKNKQVIENFELIIGARIGYITSKRTYITEYQENYIPDNNDSNESNGYEISPTIGFEYFLIDKFSIGGEFSITYQDLDNESIDRENTELAHKESGAEKTTETDSRLIARFYF